MTVGQSGRSRPASWQKFLAAYRMCGNVTQASKAAGISRQAVYKGLRNCPEFEHDFEDAKWEFIDSSLHDSLVESLITGVTTTKIKRRFAYVKVDPDTGEQLPHEPLFDSDTNDIDTAEASKGVRKVLVSEEVTEVHRPVPNLILRVLERRHPSYMPKEKRELRAQGERDNPEESYDITRLTREESYEYVRLYMKMQNTQPD